jgi:peptidoglycan/xylan/chitin deacetylase (PgdA/CDA1 family)
MSGISILMYHQVGRFPPMKTHRAVYCDVGRFRLQMRTLRALRVPVLSMSETVACLRGQAPMPNRAVTLTFDDGCENFYENALPVLEEFGLPAIVYAITELAGGPATWLAADGHPTPPLMNFERLREIASRGIEVGSHGARHVRLEGLPPEALRAEVAGSRERLQDELGQRVQHFCYPYGSHDLAAVEAAADAGYESGVTCQRAAATPAFDLLALPRKAISYGDDIVGFLWKLYAKDAPKGQAIRRPR